MMRNMWDHYGKTALKGWLMALPVLLILRFLIGGEIQDWWGMGRSALLLLGAMTLFLAGIGSASDAPETGIKMVVSESMLLVTMLVTLFYLGNILYLSVDRVFSPLLYVHVGAFGVLLLGLGTQSYYGSVSVLANDEGEEIVESLYSHV